MYFDGQLLATSDLATVRLWPYDKLRLNKACLTTFLEFLGFAPFRNLLQEPPPIAPGAPGTQGRGRGTARILGRYHWGSSGYCLSAAR